MGQLEGVPERRVTDPHGGVPRLSATARTMKLARLARLTCRVTPMAGCGREPTFGLLGRAGGHNHDLASVTLITISIPKESLKVVVASQKTVSRAPGPPFAELSSEADVPVHEDHADAGHQLEDGGRRKVATGSSLVEKCRGYPVAPVPSGQPGPVPLERTCLVWPCLHPLKEWSPQRTRGGSTSTMTVPPSRTESLGRPALSDS
jgi:hypothetical protein